MTQKRLLVGDDPWPDMFGDQQLPGYDLTETYLSRHHPTICSIKQKKALAPGVSSYENYTQEVQRPNFVPW